MTIDEIRKERDELAQRIGMMCQEFQDKTGVSVHRIECENDVYANFTHPPYRLITEVKVILESL